MVNRNYFLLLCCNNLTTKKYEKKLMYCLTVLLGIVIASSFLFSTPLDSNDCDTEKDKACVVGYWGCYWWWKTAASVGPDCFFEGLENKWD